MRSLSLIPLAIALVSTAACATSATSSSLVTPEEASRDVAKFAAAEANAAEPVRNVRFLQPIDSIEIVDPHAVLVWETPFKAWLVDLRPSAACNHLERSIGLAIDSMSNTLNDTTASIKGDAGLRCEIQRIREVDVPAMRATLRESGNG